VKAADSGTPAGLTGSAAPETIRDGPSPKVSDVMDLFEELMGIASELDR
jgi:hypothetical protein